MEKRNGQWFYTGYAFDEELHFNALPHVKRSCAALTSADPFVQQ